MERDETLRRVEGVEASLSSKGTQLKVAHRATEEAEAKHHVVLRKMMNATWRVSRLESDISLVYKRLAVSAKDFKSRCEAMAERLCVRVDRMCESLSLEF